MGIITELPALSRQILEQVKTCDEMTVKEIEDSTGANRNAIKVTVKHRRLTLLRASGQGTWRELHDPVVAGWKQ
jgi:hypothetical protein